MTEFAPLEIPVIGEFEGLEGFDGLQKQMDVGASAGGGQAAGGGGGAGALGALGGVAEGAGIMSKGGGKATSLLSGISSSMTAMLGAVLGIVGLLLMLEPVQKLLGMILDFIEAIFVLTSPVFLLLAVAMGLLMRVIPVMMDFFLNPVSSLMDIARSIGEWVVKGINILKDAIGSMVNDFIAGLSDFFSPVINAVSAVESAVNDLFNFFTGGNKNRKTIKDISKAAQKPGVQLKGSAATREMNLQQGFTRTITDAERRGRPSIPNAQPEIKIEGDTINMSGATTNQINSIQRQKEKSRNRILGAIQNWFSQ